MTPDKTEGMTNPKIKAFLMRPASSPAMAGGTPQANEAGGHIRKAAANGSYVVRADGWTHVFDAASVALVQLSRKHLMRAENGQEARAGEPYGGLFPCEIAADKAAKAPQCGDHAGNDQEGWEGGGLAHGSGSYGCGHYGHGSLEGHLEILKGAFDGISERLERSDGTQLVALGIAVAGASLFADEQVIAADRGARSGPTHCQSDQAIAGLVGKTNLDQAVRDLDEIDAVSDVATNGGEAKAMGTSTATHGSGRLGFRGPQQFGGNTLLLLDQRRDDAIDQTGR